ncbi:MAG: FtsW/RodA/SpoVE family cell cycle protein [Candidatus Cardinium sp.]|uniref:Probable peptidoglycan glycosyltransferase FtsW n=1 Tax=Candidatus Cardinium hertigii TaxID=247481 RepID=A0A2Z3LFQ2_9BACT|nr:FtsW/RodA/SpoVE family cell cycle protein [Candidatus Cardinium hertigii]AWN81415.1 putative peptidoglycan glycosyltransferase FtsW [Candidatus Cardinium hertigii]MDD9139811.1 FtsW/RodA/SpoVE family cell cycle protein [Candidatus Cardinium sp.]
MHGLIKARLKGDPVIWGVAFLLSSLSMLTVYSAVSSLAYRQMHYNTEYYLLKQVILIGMGLSAMWLLHRVDYRYYATIAKAALWSSIPLLLLTWKYGLKLNEASRWLPIPLINKSFQPSDFAQLALIIQVSYHLAKQQKNITSLKITCLPMFVWIGLVSGLIALTNCSAAILLFGTCLVLMYIGRIPVKYLCIITLMGSLMGGGALCLGQRSKTAAKRIENFLKGETSFQVEQAYIAIATGGIMGKGPGKSSQRNFLPHPYSDFIYAILIEEYGLVGALFVMLLYLLLLYRAIVLLPTVANSYAGLLAIGVSLLLVFQALLNMAVAVGLGPVTGLPLPFVSMGGTSIVFTGIALGILLSISRGVIDPELAILQQEAAGIPCNRYKAQNLA